MSKLELQKAYTQSNHQWPWYLSIKEKELCLSRTVHWLVQIRTLSTNMRISSPFDSADAWEQLPLLARRGKTQHKATVPPCWSLLLWINMLSRDFRHRMKLSMIQWHYYWVNEQFRWEQSEAFSVFWVLCVSHKPGLACYQYLNIKHTNKSKD